MCNLKLCSYLCGRKVDSSFKMYNDVRYSFSPYLIGACCAEHNFCEIANGQVNPTWILKATTAATTSMKSLCHVNRF